MFVVPGAVDALQALAACPKGRGVPPHTLELVHLRASKINGCSVCVDLHSRNLKKAGETGERLAALRALSSAGEKSGVSREIVGLAQLRASQINGCSVCVEAHCRQMKKAGESDERLFAVAAWRDAPYFTNAERAALALAEALTRLNDREDPVDDSVWAGLPGISARPSWLACWSAWRSSTSGTASTWRPGSKPGRRGDLPGPITAAR